jgi:hypothetical protein
LQASRKRSFVDKASITPSKMTDNPTKLISVAFYNEQNQFFVTGIFYRFNGSLLKPKQAIQKFLQPPLQLFFFLLLRPRLEANTHNTDGGRHHATDQCYMNIIHCLIATLPRIFNSTQNPASAYHRAGCVSPRERRGGARVNEKTKQIRETGL